MNDLARKAFISQILRLGIRGIREDDVEDYFAHVHETNGTVSVEGFKEWLGV